MVKIRDHPIKMDHLGGKPSIFGNTQLFFCWSVFLFFFPGIWKFSHDLLLDKAVFGNFRGDGLVLLFLGKYPKK